jgi:pyridoxal phosphate enzyme (YggS family)
LPFNHDRYQALSSSIPAGVTLVAVSKTKPVEDLREAYAAGIRDFGENYVQELTEKQPLLPEDIRWHFIGHLQSNKVKYIAPFVHLIHGVDSLKLLQEINKQGKRINRKIHCLLQVYIAKEESKFGMDELELTAALTTLKDLEFVVVDGLMGMASFSDNKETIANEFTFLQSLYQRYREKPVTGFDPQILSMGMSGDYNLAIEKGSNMIRVGSLLFGSRVSKQ